MDDVITLVKESTVSYDKYGNEIRESSERQVFCQIHGITRTEFYSAATANLRPEITARLSEAADYEGETLVRYNDVLYSVIRTYRDRGSMQQYGGMSPNAIELVLERKIGNE